MFYQVRKRQDNIHEDKPVKFYPYPRYMGKVNLQQLSEEIANASSLTRGDVESTVLNLLDTMSKYLKEGHSIQLGEFCTLRMSFSADGSDEKEEVDHTKIKKTKLVFTPGKGLRKHLKDVNFQLFRK
jgi:DNA-binding protein, histone-like, putative